MFGIYCSPDFQYCDKEYEVWWQALYSLLSIFIYSSGTWPAETSPRELSFV